MCKGMGSCTWACRLLTQVANLRYRRESLLPAGILTTNGSAGAFPPPLGRNTILRWNCLLGYFGSLSSKTTR